MKERLHFNTHSGADALLARELGIGLEVEKFIFFPTDEAIFEVELSLALAMIEGISRTVFHGTTITRDIESMARMPREEVFAAYNKFIATAERLGIKSVVFHSRFFPGACDDGEWVRREEDFWREFLHDLPEGFDIYLENVVDETPDAMAVLHDRVADPRFSLCLDTGHAHCNSRSGAQAFVDVLGLRIRHVHLHNNDGASDKHWPPQRGTLFLANVVASLEGLQKPPTYTLECDAAQGLEWLQNQGFIAKQ